MNSRWQPADRRCCWRAMLEISMQRRWMWIVTAYQQTHRPGPGRLAWFEGWRSVCLSVSWFVTIVSPAKTAEPIEMLSGMCTRVASGKRVTGTADGFDGVRIGATWRIRSNRPCAAAMRPYIKSLWLLVIFILLLLSFLFCCCCFFVCSVPADIVKSVLSSSSRTSFYGFLSALAKSAALNDHIGTDIVIVKPRLHDTTGCQTGLTTELTTGYIV